METRGKSEGGGVNMCAHDTSEENEGMSVSPATWAISLSQQWRAPWQPPHIQFSNPLCRSFYSLRTLFESVSHAADKAGYVAPIF